jgi:hypothetical protein
MKAGVNIDDIASPGGRKSETDLVHLFVDIHAADQWQLFAFAPESSLPTTTQPSHSKR